MSKKKTLDWREIEFLNADGILFDPELLAQAVVKKQGGPVKRKIKLNRGAPYPRIKLLRRPIPIHQLVMEHLYPYLSMAIRGGHTIVHHTNENPLDARVENLEIISRIEHAWRHHLKEKTAATHTGAKRTDEARQHMSESQKLRWIRRKQEASAQ